MSYKVMGITAGRKNSNSEILLKEALMACEEKGAEIVMINLKDYKILPCTGCTSCTKNMSMGKNAGCVLDDKDDKKKIMDTKDLRCFRQVYEDRSINQEAKQLFITPQGLSRIITKLDGKLNSFFLLL